MVELTDWCSLEAEENQAYRLVRSYLDCVVAYYLYFVIIPVAIVVATPVVIGISVPPAIFVVPFVSEFIVVPIAVAAEPFVFVIFLLFLF